MPRVFFFGREVISFAAKLFFLPWQFWATVNNAFRARWLASLEMNTKYVFTSERPKGQKLHVNMIWK